jgi:predicted ATP-grasp superfamily ATP-dependent carboligase
LRGLFGCDFLIGQRDGVPWLTEVNPRYPASTELVEHLSAVPLLDWHRRACEPLVVPPFVVAPSGGRTIDPRLGSTTTVLGKLILYAQSSLTAPDLSRFLIHPHCWISEPATHIDKLPFLADIPVPGTHIAAGQPICTLFARASDADNCLMKLLRRAARLESRLSD